MMSGYIYLLSNPSMPGLLKIGYTRDFPEQRLSQLSTTSVPLPFVLEACFLVNDPELLEQKVHATLAQYRLVRNREFFQLSTSQALELILPLVIHTIGYVSIGPPKIAYKAHGLSDNEVLFLQILVSAGSQHGMSQWRLKEHTEIDGLDTEIAIASLVAKKFVVRSRNSDNYGPTWLPTPKGTKFLVENDLIEEWMK